MTIRDNRRAEDGWDTACNFFIFIFLGQTLIIMYISRLHLVLMSPGLTSRYINTGPIESMT